MSFRPFTIDHASYLWNMLPYDLLPYNLTPMEVWISTNQDVSPLKSEKVWRCPAYVLDPRLQDGKKIPKWVKDKERQVLRKIF